jgi:hypothetical protein
MLVKLKSHIFCYVEIERIQKGETKKETERETYLDLFTTKNIKVKERVLIPVKQYPRVSKVFSCTIEAVSLGHCFSYAITLTAGFIPLQLCVLKLLSHMSIATVP